MLGCFGLIGAIVGLVGSIFGAVFGFLALLPFLVAGAIGLWVLKLWRDTKKMRGGA